MGHQWNNNNRDCSAATQSRAFACPARWPLSPLHHFLGVSTTNHGGGLLSLHGKPPARQQPSRKPHTQRNVLCSVCSPGHRLCCRNYSRRHHRAPIRNRARDLWHEHSINTARVDARRAPCLADTRTLPHAFVYLAGVGPARVHADTVLHPAGDDRVAQCKGRRKKSACRTPRR